MVLHRFLALNGIESRINFGLKRTTDGRCRGTPGSNATGRPFLEDDAGTYVVTFSLPRPPASWDSCSRG